MGIAASGVATVILAIGIAFAVVFLVSRHEDFATVSIFQVAFVGGLSFVVSSTLLSAIFERGARRAIDSAPARDRDGNPIRENGRGNPGISGWHGTLADWKVAEIDEQFLTVFDGDERRDVPFSHMVDLDVATVSSLMEPGPIVDRDPTLMTARQRRAPDEAALVIRFRAPIDRTSTDRTSTDRAAAPTGDGWIVLRQAWLASSGASLRDFANALDRRRHPPESMGRVRLGRRFE